MSPDREPLIRFVRTPRTPGRTVREVLILPVSVAGIYIGFGAAGPDSQWFLPIAMSLCALIFWDTIRSGLLKVFKRAVRAAASPPKT